MFPWWRRKSTLIGGALGGGRWEVGALADVGCWMLDVGSRLEAGGWRLEAGSRRAEVGC
jgi:hypothetical protein